MIQAILYDMDGVLIDAKDWHYEALNRALDLFGMTIERDAHLSIFDGLPTREKLKILSQSRGLPEELHEFLNELKQSYTAEITASKCKPNFQHCYALSSLAAQGYKQGLCSNSVRSSVETMMSLSGLGAYLNIMISNEEVVKPKPDPEMYLSAMDRLSVQPKQTLILEDNSHGIAAARASGAHVLVVGSVDDVTLQRIEAEIRAIDANS